MKSIGLDMGDSV